MNRTYWKLYLLNRVKMHIANVFKVCGIVNGKFYQPVDVCLKGLRSVGCLYSLSSLQKGYFQKA